MYFLIKPLSMSSVNSREIPPPSVSLVSRIISSRVKPLLFLANAKTMSSCRSDLLNNDLKIFGNSVLNKPFSEKQILSIFCVALKPFFTASQ